MDEAEGIKAIIYLQAMAGIVETEESAKLGWSKLDNSERETTLWFYRLAQDLKEKKEI